MQKKIVAYGVLSLGTFAATFAYVTMQRGGSLPWRAAGGSEAVVTAASQRAPMPGAPALQPGGIAGGAGMAGLGVDHGEEQRREVAEVVAAARHTIASADPEQRRVALNQLGTMGAPGAVAPELLRTLGDAALGDGQWQIRMQAVISLARIARGMPDKSQVLPLLQRATEDTNKAVAARARAALASLTAPPPDEPVG